MTPNSDHNNNFNLLRFFFASLVIVSHAPELISGNRENEILTQIFGSISFGELAVDSFFVISGYLITKSWLTRPHIAHFLTNRFLRIFPGFTVASLICALIVAPIYGAPNYFDQLNVPRYLASLASLKSPQIPPVFEGTHHAVVNGSMWSISYEFYCYMLVLLFGILGVLRKKFVWAGISLIFCALYILDKTGIFALNSVRIYIRCGMAFLFGGCFYIFKENIIWSRRYAACALAGFFLLLFVDALAEVAASLLLGYVIIYYANTGKSLLSFNRLPDVSYGIYLYAWPINKIILWHNPQINEYLSIPIVLLLSIIAGIFSWYLIEKPCLQLKKYISMGPRKIGPVGA